MARQTPPPHDKYDAVVVGAGPAGAVTARGLALAGWRVALIDRARFPRAKVCGCCLNGMAFQALSHLGLSDVLHDAAPLDRIRLQAGRRSVELPLRDGHVLSRTRFDQRLVAAAVAAGVELFESTLARLEPLNDAGGSGRRMLRLQPNDPADSPARRLAARRLAARWVVAADGLASPLTHKEPGMASRVARGSRIGAGAILTPTEIEGCLPDPGEIRMLVGPTGYVGLCRLEDGRVDVAAAIDREAIQTAGGLGQASLQILRQAGFVAADSLAAADWRGTPSLTRRRRPWGERVVAVGDAAGYVEPFTGQGMAWAIHSAALLIPLLDQALGQSWTSRRLGRAWQRQHGRSIGRQQRVCRRVAKALRHPWLLGVATRWLSSHPGWAAPLVARIQHATLRLPAPPGRLLLRQSPTATADVPRVGGGGTTMVLEAIGTALPENRLAQTDTAIALARLAGGSATIYQALCQRAGIEQRHFALPMPVLRDLVEGTAESGSVFVPQPGSDPDGPSTGERLATYQQLAPDLAVRAAREAIEASATSLSDITHLVIVSCTGMAAPGVDFQLIKRLGLDPQVQRLQVGFMGCHGAINGLRATRGLLAAQAEPTARALLVAVELCSLHVRSRADGGGMVANALFADGAAAVICRAALDMPDRVCHAPLAQPEQAAPPIDSPPIGPPDAPSDGPTATLVRSQTAAAETTARTVMERPRWRLVDGGSMLFPDSERAMTWTVGDHGFVMTLDRQVPQLIATHLRSWLEPWLEQRGIPLAGVGAWCIHPGGPKILQAAADALGLSQTQIRVSASLLAEVGNLSSPTLLFALDRFRGAAAKSPCVMLGFGPGLVAEVALLV